MDKIPGWAKALFLMILRWVIEEAERDPQPAEKEKEVNQDVEQLRHGDESG